MKRLVSFLLILIMFFGIMSVGVFAVEGEAFDIRFFDVDPDTLAEKNGTTTYVTTTTKSADGSWWIDTANTLNLHYNIRYAARINIAAPAYPYIQITQRSTDTLGGAFTVNFTVPKTGKYDVTALGMMYSSCGVVDFYIDGIYLGSYDFKKADSTLEDLKAGVPAVLRAVELTEGTTHKLTIRPLTGNNAMIEGFDFAPCASTDSLSKINISADETALCPGGTSQLTVGAVLSDGGRYDISKGFKKFDGTDDSTVSLTYESSKPEFATVSQTGLVTAIADGETEITATFKMGTEEKSEKIKITVESPKLSEVTLSSDADYILLDDADGMATALSAVMTDGTSVDMTDPAVSVKYTSSPEGLVTVSDDGIIMPKALGDVKITAAVTLDGVTVEDSIDITVSDKVIYPTFDIEFSSVDKASLVVAPGSNQTYCNADTYGENWTIDTQNSDAAQYDGSKDAVRIQPSVKWAYIKNKGKFAIKVNAKRAGKYDVAVRHTPYSSNSTADIYVNGKYIGTFDNYANSTDIYATKEDVLLGVELNKGENTVTIYPSGGKNVFVQGFTFTGTDTPAALSGISAEPESVTLYENGKTQSMTVSAVATNGARYDIKKLLDGSSSLEISYESSSPTIAEVDANGVITPKTAGQAVITAAATGTEFTDTTSVTVEVPKLQSVSVTAEKKYILLSDTEGMKLSVSAKMTDGNALDLNEAEVTWSAFPENIVSVMPDGTVKPEDLGDVTITAAVTYNGVTETGTLPLIVSEAPVYESFEVYFNEKAAWDTVVDVLNKDGSKSPGYFSADTHGTNWRVDTEKSAKEFFSATSNAARIQKRIVEFIYLKNYGDFAVKFTVPEDGYYDLTANAMHYTSTGLAKFYIDGKFVGEVDTYTTPGDIYSAVATPLRSVYLTADGEHSLIIRNGGKTGGGTNLFIRSISFTGKGAHDGIKSVDIELPCDSYAAGESDEYRIKVTQNNGAGYYLPLINSDGTTETELFAKSGDETSVTVSEGTFTAIKSGKTRLTVEGKIDGFDVSGFGTVNVSEVTYDRADVNLSEELIYFVGGSKKLYGSAILSDGRVTDSKNISNVRFKSSDETVAKISADGTISFLKEDTVDITAWVTFNNLEKSVTKTIKVENVKLASITAKTEDNVVFALDRDGSQMIVTGVKNNGDLVDISGSEFSYESLTPDIVTVDETGRVYYASRGTGKIRVTATVSGFDTPFTCEAEVISSSAKTGPTIYTDDMRKMALVNGSKHEWARSLVKSAKAKADAHLETFEELYMLIPGEGLPRSYTITTLSSPGTMTYICPYCKLDLRAAKSYGAYSWVLDPVRDPWKVKCPDCKRSFPSNDFEGFYELGYDKKTGTFSREEALRKHGELYGTSDNPYGYGKGFLKNELYTEKEDTWMVDDGFGWSPRDGVPGSSESVKTNPKYAPIALYMHYFWDRNGSAKSVLCATLDDLRDAYLYTGEEKYGIAGAILLDRVADVYPTYDLKLNSLSYSNSHGGDYNGKIVGNIWETNIAESLTRAYDAFYPEMSNPKVIGYLSEKAKYFGLDNPKTNADLIRENAENGIIREVFDGAKGARVLGNFGMHQANVALCAVALDTQPETDEMIAWLKKPSTESQISVTDPIYNTEYAKTTVSNSGGEMVTRYINEVDRDGFGNEVGIGYNRIWVTDALTAAEMFDRHGIEDPDLDFFSNAKYVKMFNSIIKETVGSGYSLHIGDSGNTAGTTIYSTADETLRAYYKLRDPELAKNIYFTLGGDVDDIHVDIFTDNEGLGDEIKAAVEEHGELELKSENLTGFGLALLRGGELIRTPGAIADKDYRHDAWMYYGRTSVSHGHRDMLQLGIDAYGFNFTPDLGYPEATGLNENRWQWVSNTLSHNTVQVDNEYQNGIYGGTPLHFDSRDNVKLMDVDAPNAYGTTDIYRRTAVSVAASNEVSYTVDFFRVKGGKSHVYSFHTQSYKGYTTKDLTLVPQLDENGNDGMIDENGEYRKYTYAGIGKTYTDKETGEEKTVLYGPDPNASESDVGYGKLMFPRGYTWLTEVSRAENIEDGSFDVNFEQTDFRHQVGDPSGLNLKFTALNDWTPTDIGFATGYPPRTATNDPVPGLDYMLIHRESEEELDTLFTSVIQPYKGDEYIESIESIPLISSGGEGEDDVAKAVKVTLKNGRCDYIIYATNNNVTYTVKDNDVEFDFRGFVGVYSITRDSNGTPHNIYAYVNDGDLIGDVNGRAAYTGEVVSFTEALTDENIITVKLNEQVDNFDELSGEYVYVKNTGTQNGSYRIVKASPNTDNSDYIDLHLGDVSLIKAFVNNADFSQGYQYNIAKRQKLEILLTSELDDKPYFMGTESLRDLTVTAGSTITVDVNAESPKQQAIRYEARDLPRGASVDETTGTMTWRPDSSQVGKAGVLIAAIDENGREETVSYEITVYGSTTGKPSQDENNTGSTDTTDTPSGGGGGGGGGGGAGGAPDTDENVGDDDESLPLEEKVPSEGEADEVENGDTTNLRFTDLGSHAWASDAINELSEKGIIKGTSDTTFSPSANITRADFAILLVRAFDLTSDNTENFSDVEESDYFARELAIARNCGIVGGIGDNKYAPRNTIPRQDMMVIVYRALKSLPLEGKGDRFAVDEVSCPDFNTVAEYAREAVTFLISEGLVNGKNGKIDPEACTTRAEVAVLVKRILDYIAE
ncbi:MAG: S-layer homology domain-containing protein [Oscillospiraceae bacterium]|nr:S-layer homology domain-containing protein [Oscillospiraceae bacterium]